MSVPYHALVHSILLIDPHMSKLCNSNDKVGMRSDIWATWHNYNLLQISWYWCL